MRAVGFDAKALQAAGVTLPKLRAAGVSVSDLRSAGFSCDELRTVGVKANQLHDAGASGAELKEAGFPLTEFCKLCPVGELRECGFSCEELRKVGFKAKDVLSTGATTKELTVGGYSAGELKECGSTAKELKVLQFTCAELKKCGFNAKALVAVGFDSYALKVLVCFSSSLLHRTRPCHTPLLCSSLMPTSFSSIRSSLQMGGFRARDVKDCGFKGSSVFGKPCDDSLSQMCRDAASASMHIDPRSPHTHPDLLRCTSFPSRFALAFTQRRPLLALTLCLALAYPRRPRRAEGRRLHRARAPLRRRLHSAADEHVLQRGGAAQGRRGEG